MINDEPPLFVTTIEGPSADLEMTTVESDPVLVHSLTDDGGQVVVGVHSITESDSCHLAIGIDEPPTARSTHLRVGVIPPTSDSTSFQILVDTVTKEKLNITDGDVVWVSGDRRTPCVVTEASPADQGLSIGRCNPLVRQNAGTSLGETVDVTPAPTTKADVVKLAVPGYPQEVDDSLGDDLSGRPVVEGDLTQIQEKLINIDSRPSQELPPKFQNDRTLENDALIAEVRTVKPNTGIGTVATITPETNITLTAADDIQFDPEEAEQTNGTFQVGNSDGESSRSSSSGNAEFTSACISSLLHSAHYNAKNLSIFAAIANPATMPILMAESEERAREIASQINNQEDMERVANSKSSITAADDIQFDPEEAEQTNGTFQVGNSNGESSRSSSSGNAGFTSACISSLLHSAHYNAKNLSIFAAIANPATVPILMAESEERAREIASQINNQEDMERVANSKSSNPDTTTSIARPTHKIPGSVDLELPNSITYNELEFGDRIGGGGFAEIRAADVRSTSDTQIAVKRLSDEGTVTKEKINRFIEEAELWAQCDDHSHVVSVIDWGHVPRPWIAMEHLTGGDLRDRIHDADRGLPLDESLWIATVLAETLADVHHLGVRHLDLQARNIVFAATPEDVWMFPKIGDWGTAKAQRTQKKSPSVLNPSYAAPEQFESDRVLDHRTDIYQLGAVIYELLTGQVPTANGATGKSIGERSLPIPPSELRSELPASIDEVIQTALDPLPSNRYSRAIYLSDALDELVED